MYTKPFYINLLLSFLTVLLLSFSFPLPCISFLAWIALIPWLVIISSGYKVVLFSYIIGALFFVFNLSWVRYVTYPGWFLLSFYLAAYLLAFGAISYYLRKNLRLPHIFTAPFIWVAFEYLRSSPLSGLPWFFIGHSQYLNLSLIQIVDVTGVYGVSFVIVVFNAAIADLIGRLLIKKTLYLSADSIVLSSGKRNFYCFTIVVPALLLFLVLLYGHFCLRNYADLENGPDVCVVQGNIPQNVKLDPDEKQKEKTLMKYVNLSLETVGKGVDLIVWPETMVPGILNLDPKIFGRKIDILSKELIQDLAKVTRAHLILGGTAIDIQEKYPLYFNTAFYYDNEGKLINRYDKIHLVPFGEFIPFEKYFPFLGNIVPYDVSLTNGEIRTIFELGTKDGNKVFKFGVLICYEDAIAPFVRKYKKDRADFIINITNDAWFSDSSELDQHLAVMVFRAIENRICIVRAANTGISSFVAPDGEIYAYLTRNGKHKEIDGILHNKIKLVNTANTWYTNHGDVFALLCLSVTTILLLVAFYKANFHLTFKWPNV